MVDDDMGRLSDDELNREKDKGKEWIRDQQLNRKADTMRLKTAIEDDSRRQFEEIQSWISNNLEYLHGCTDRLAIFATDDLSQAMIKALKARLRQIKVEFDAATKPEQQKVGVLPFDPTFLVHNRQAMMPLLGQIIPLKYEIDGFVRQFFNVSTN